MLGRLRQVHAHYQQRNFEFFESVEVELQEAESFFQKHNFNVHASKATSLLSNLSALRSGFNPFTHQRLEKNQRNAKYAVGLQIVQELEGILLASLDKQEQKIEQAKEMIEGLLLSFLQKMPQDLALSLSDTRSLWHQMGKDAQSALFQKKVLLTVHQEDALILIDQALSQLLQPEPAHDLNMASTNAV